MRSVTRSMNLAMSEFVFSRLASNRAAGGVDPTGCAAAASRLAVSAVAQVGTGPASAQTPLVSSAASVSYFFLSSGVSSLPAVIASFFSCVSIDSSGSSLCLSKWLLTSGGPWK